MPPASYSARRSVHPGCWITAHPASNLMRAPRPPLDSASVWLLERTLSDELTQRCAQLNPGRVLGAGAPRSPQALLSEARAALRQLRGEDPRITRLIPAGRRAPEGLSDPELLELHRTCTERLDAAMRHPDDPSRWRGGDELPALISRAPRLMAQPGYLTPETEGELGPDGRPGLLSAGELLHVLDLRSRGERPHPRVWAALSRQLQGAADYWGRLPLRWVAFHRPLHGQTCVIALEDLPALRWPRGAAEDLEALGPEHLKDPALALHLANGVAKHQPALRQEIYELKSRALSRLNQEGRLRYGGHDAARAQHRELVEADTALGVRGFHLGGSELRALGPLPLRTAQGAPAGAWGTERLPADGTQTLAAALSAHLGSDAAIVALRRWLESGA